jgi:hypothetical protein
VTALANVFISFLAMLLAWMVLRTHHDTVVVWLLLVAIAIVQFSYALSQQVRLHCETSYSLYPGDAVTILLSTGMGVAAGICPFYSEIAAILFVALPPFPFFWLFPFVLIVSLIPPVLRLTMLFRRTYICSRLST